MREKPKQIAGLLAVVLFIYWMGSCTLEPSVESPAARLTEAITGMPDGLKIYEPQITTDGTTTTLTYTVSADFSKWSASPLEYTAQEDVVEDDTLEAQSVEALILKYGKTDSDEAWLFKDAVPAVEAEMPYPLDNTTGKGTPFALIQLDTERIKSILLNKRPPVDNKDPNGDPVYENIVWVEENEGGIANIEQATKDWGLADNVGNKFVDPTNGVRVLGLHVFTGEDDIKTLKASGTIENFDDGKAVYENKDPSPERDLSISTVLAGGTTKKKERYTATINFYTGDEVTRGENSAETIMKKLTPVGNKDNEGNVTYGSLPSSASPDAMKKWITNNPPVLRVVYRWADDVLVNGK
jgi:hypothetical protein